MFKLLRSLVGKTPQGMIVEAVAGKVIDKIEDKLEEVVKDKMEEMHLNSELTVVELSRDMLRSYVQRNHLTLEVALGR